MEASGTVKKRQESSVFIGKRNKASVSVRYFRRGQEASGTSARLKKSHKAPGNKILWL